MTQLAVAARITSPSEAMLLLRRALPPQQGLWALPGGTVVDDETPEEALHRELQEELGVRPDRVRYLGAHWYEPEDGSRVLTMLYDVSTQDVPRNSEPEKHSELDWVSADVPLDRLSQSAQVARTGIWPTHEELPPALQPPTDVLLIQPHFPLADAEALSIPLGLASLHASLTRHGYVVAALDCSLADDYDIFVADLDQSDARVVGIQFHSFMAYDFAIRCCRRVRRVLPNAVIVGGGELATTRWRSLLDAGVIDVAVLSEGERTFCELMGVLDDRGIQGVDSVPGLAVRRQEAGPVLTPDRPLIDELDSLAMPSIDAFRWRSYGQWSLFTSRGCRYRCSYCSSAAFWHHTIRYHSPRRVGAEMARLKQYGAHDVYIADDTFTQSRDRTLAICDELRPLGMGWSCLTRVDLVDEPLLEAMAGAGCKQISFGFETANQATLEIVSKHAKVDRARRTLEACREAGIRTRTSVIVPLPGEHREDVMRTIEWLEAVRPNEVQLYGLTPHDGTALYKDLDRYGVQVIEEDPMLWSRDVMKPVCVTRELDEHAIRELARECVDTLVSHGYVYLHDGLPQRKLHAEYTVATAFSPVQSIGGVEEAE